MKYATLDGADYTIWGIVIIVSIAVVFGDAAYQHGRKIEKMNQKSLIPISEEVESAWEHISQFLKSDEQSASMAIIYDALMAKKEVVSTDDDDKIIYVDVRIGPDEIHAVERGKYSLSDSMFIGRLVDAYNQAVIDANK